MAIGLSAAACSTYTTTTAVAPAPVVASGSQQACVDYGFTPGTGAYDRCVSREHEARLRGRVAVGYADAQLAEDARAACYSYGLDPATPRYDRCVGREIDARRYRDSTTTVYVPAAGTTTTYTTVYTPPAVPPPTPYVETRNSNTAGVQAFRDEYGFRYDAEGNRLDRNGNIISPQSTQP
ncbi:MAG: hypothetical protein JSR47_03265 [Proteobacteria bacterium]|nr:hypothetical protein [Pseudomonadota bacterium]